MVVRWPVGEGVIQPKGEDDDEDEASLEVSSELVTGSDRFRGGVIGGVLFIVSSLRGGILLCVMNLSF